MFKCLLNTLIKIINYIMENTNTKPLTSAERAQEATNVKVDGDIQRLEREDARKREQEREVSRNSVFGLNKPKPTSGGRRRTMRRKRNRKHKRSVRRF